jgi:hypothetical protein
VVINHSAKTAHGVRLARAGGFELVAITPFMHGILPTTG